MKKKLVLLLIALFAVLSTKIFNYSSWNAAYGGYFNIAIFILLIYNALFGKYNHKTIFVGRVVPYFLIVILFSCISSWVLYGTSLRLQLGTLIDGLVFLFYYFLKCYNIKSETLLKIFIYISIIGLCIQIYQMLFPNHALFGKFSEEMQSHMGDMKVIAESRNNIYRWNILTDYFCVFSLFYVWSLILTKWNLKNIILFAALLVSIYLLLTRQIILIVLIGLFSTLIFKKSERYNKKLLGAFIVIGGILLVYFSNTLFGELLGQTEEDMSNKYIRFVSAQFYFEKIIQDPVSFLFGNGHPEILSKWQKEKHMYPSDVGVIGEVFYYGIFWLVIYIYTLYLILKKYSEAIPLYIKLFCFSTFFNSIMIFPYTFMRRMFIWTVMIYICDIYIARHKAREIERRKEIEIKKCNSDMLEAKTRSKV